MALQAGDVAWMSAGCAYVKCWGCSECSLNVIELNSVAWQEWRGDATRWLRGWISRQRIWFLSCKQGLATTALLRMVRYLRPGIRWEVLPYWITMIDQCSFFFSPSSLNSLRSSIPWVLRSSHLWNKHSSPTISQWWVPFFILIIFMIWNKLRCPCFPSLWLEEWAEGPFLDHLGSKEELWWPVGMPGFLRERTNSSGKVSGSKAND